jgi:hypothetical protein
MRSFALRQFLKTFAIVVIFKGKLFLWEICMVKRAKWGKGLFYWRLLHFLLMQHH